MKAFVAVTDKDWFTFLRSQRGIKEVNFWKPGGGTNFKALLPGQPLLFKLHHPDNYIVGGGFFERFSKLPASLAWETFGIENGAPDFATMRERIVKYRKADRDSREDFQIGCIILVDPFFLEEVHWVPMPDDFSLNTVQGKGYDLREESGRRLWEQVAGARGLSLHRAAEAPVSPMFGEPTLFRPRLGQGGFRVAVTDAYRRHCAITGEKTLPVLEAAHIKPVAEGGMHSVDNGLLLRSDIHTLFDRGYVTVTPRYEFRVSQRLREDWSNGRVYYALDGKRIELPEHPTEQPNRLALEWHADTVFKG